MPDIDLTLAFACGAVLLVGVVLYAVLAGADFGGGVWELLARGPRAAEQQQAVTKAIGPVWEANHVWLIFVIVVTFTAFPPVFAGLSTALYVPFTLALIGIVFRGSAFVFRNYAVQARIHEKTWGHVFEIASVITPFLFGMVAGAVASGDITFEDGHFTGSYWSTWLAPFPALIGLLALTTCAYLAAVYLTLETSGALQEDFRTRALWTGAVFTAVAVISLPVSRSTAPVIWDGLVEEVYLVVPSTLVLLTLSGWAVWTRRYRLARAAGAGSVAVMLAGWALAQYPYLVVSDLTFDDSAAPDATLKALLIVLLLGSMVLIPSLWLLFSIFKRPATIED